MIYAKFLESVGVNHYLARGEIDAEELFKLQREQFLSSGEKSPLSAPVFFDLRGADLLALDTQVFKRIIARRKSFGPETQENDFVVVVSSDVDYGMMRMYNIHAEVDGLRGEDKSFVSLDVLEAVRWLAARMENVTPEALLEALEASATQAQISTI